LNELYRAFRMGNVLTEANANLTAERLTGAEAGADAFAFRRKLNLRGNFFWDDIVNPIANVTLTTTPSLITRQRQNLGRTRSRGIQLDAVARLSNTVQISGGYEFVDATVLQFPSETTLIGLRVPEVPRHQFTLQGRWTPGRFTLSVQGRYSGAQFDDDQNTLPLDRYFTVDLLAGRSLGHDLEVFGAFDNLLDQRYTVALTPTTNLGPPFLARIGLRLNYPRRD
jgi:outer membrane receptor protein involved in Fe transport